MSRLTVYLTGFSGCGKSYLAPLVARRLKLPFSDTDAMIERRKRMTIADLFASEGERLFRNLEADVIAELSASPGPKVVALGGGAMMSPANRRRIARSGIVVYLSCSVRELYRRLKDKTDRPLLNATPRSGETKRQAGLRVIKDLIDKRQKMYQTADLKVSTTNRTPAQTATLICRKVRSYHA